MDFKKDFWEYTPDEVTTGNHSPEFINSFEVYPNPVQHEITIRIAARSTEVTVHVYDIQGKMIALPTVVENQQIQINTTSLPDGFYTLQITDNKSGASEMRNFVKQE